MLKKSFDVQSLGIDIKTCIPNKDILEPECINQGGTYFEYTENLDDVKSVGAMKFGIGCVDNAYMSNRTYWDNESFLVGGLLPSISTSYLAQMGEVIFSGGKTFKRFC